MKGYPGLDHRDELWLARQLKNPPTEDDGICFAIWRDEVLGPFACKAEAEAAQQRKLDELAAQGVDLASANPHMAVIFGDPATYHLPTEDSLNA
jgi:hypothetical protein